MSKELPFKTTFVKYGETEKSIFEAETRAGIVAAALVFHKAGAKAFKFEHYVDSVYVTDHDAVSAFEERTKRSVTSEKAVPSLMQLQETASMLRKYAAKHQLQPEHHEKLLIHALTAMHDAGVSHVQLMNQVVKVYPEIVDELRQAQELIKGNTLPLPVASSKLEELAHSQH